MKKKINIYIFYYLSILFLFSIFFLYQKHDVANDSTISEWLINYEGGFTKRGIVGQFSIYLSKLFIISLRDAIFILQITLVGTYFFLVYHFLKNIFYNKIFIFAIFTPIFILYPVAEIEVLARKEVFIFIYLLLYTLIPISRKNYKFFYKLCLFPCAILIWEPVVFFILLAFYAGMSLPMHSLAVAHTNDYVQTDEIVAASSSFAILVGIGSVMGPILVSGFMSLIGANGFFIRRPC